MSCSVMSCRWLNGDVIEKGVCVEERRVLGVAEVRSVWDVREVEWEGGDMGEVAEGEARGMSWNPES